MVIPEQAVVNVQAPEYNFLRQPFCAATIATHKNGWQPIHFLYCCYKKDAGLSYNQILLN